MIDNVIDGTKYGKQRDRVPLNNRHERYRDRRVHRRTSLLESARKRLGNKALTVCLLLFILLSGCVLTWLAFALLPWVVEILSVLERQGIEGLMDAIATFGQGLERTGK